MLRFTELYYDDAERFAKYLHEKGNGEIEIVSEFGELFPTPPKFKEIPNKVPCFKVGNIEIAYIYSEEDKSENGKYRNRNMYRYVIGQQLQQAREMQNITIEELSNRSGLPISKLRSIENGRYGESIDTIFHVARSIGCELGIICEL